MKTTKYSGYTIVELLIAVALISLIMSMTLPIFSYSKKSVKMMKELDVYHYARKANNDIATKLKYATKIIFPPQRLVRSKQYVNQLIFSNSLNQAIVYFVNTKNELMEVNYDDIRNNGVGHFRKLAGKVKSFKVRYPESNALEYKITFNLANKKTYQFSNMISFENAL